MNRKDLTFERMVSTKINSEKIQNTMHKFRSELLIQVPAWRLKTASQQFEICCVAAKIIIKQFNQ